MKTHRKRLARLNVARLPNIFESELYNLEKNTLNLSSSLFIFVGSKQHENSNRWSTVTVVLKREYDGSPYTVNAGGVLRIYQHLTVCV